MSERAGKAKISAKRAPTPSAAGKYRVEQIENRLAVRYREGAGQRLRRLLAEFGEVHEVERQRLFIVQLPDSAQDETVMQRLRQWEDEGLIEFVTPVLRDIDSDSVRILTDEITLRFKSAMPSRKLKAFAEKYGVAVLRQNEFVPTQFVVKVDDPNGLRTLEVADQLDTADEVEFAAPNFISEYRR